MIIVPVKITLKFVYYTDTNVNYLPYVKVVNTSSSYS